MAQNIHGTPVFSAGCSQSRRPIHGLAHAPRCDRAGLTLTALEGWLPAEAELTAEPDRPMPRLVGARR